MEPIPSTKIPHTFKVFTTAGGARIYRIPLKAFPNFWVYAYLVFVDGFRVLIDTGSGFGDSNVDLEAGFEQVRVETGEAFRIEDLTHILITHGHIDHFGGLTFLHERTQARIGIHELDLRTLTNYEERIVVVERRLLNYLLEAGVSKARCEAIMTMYRFNKSLFNSVPVDFTYEAVGMQLGPFEFLHVPGHSPGHVVIRLHDFLFSGDHVLSRISPHQWPERLTLHTGLEHYIDSLCRLEAWDTGATLTLGGHNDPIEDLPARLGEIRRVHAERLQKVLEILSEPHTIAEVSRALFGKVSGYNVLLAVEETGAHVEYLYQRGLLGIDNVHELEAQAVPVRYQRLNDPVAAQVKPCC
ncbi:MAG: MBL fold metallo-hydrolase [Chloroflexi bacterium]|nr:MBL fold metallo-hydrolase [Chloroflexota bacterium]